MVLFKKRKEKRTLRDENKYIRLNAYDMKIIYDTGSLSRGYKYQVLVGTHKGKNFYVIISTNDQGKRAVEDIGWAPLDCIDNGQIDEWKLLCYIADKHTYMEKLQSKISQEFCYQLASNKRTIYTDSYTETFGKRDEYEEVEVMTYMGKYFYVISKTKPMSAWGSYGLVPSDCIDNGKIVEWKLLCYIADKHTYMEELRSEMSKDLCGRLATNKKLIWSRGSRAFSGETCEEVEVMTFKGKWLYTISATYGGPLNSAGTYGFVPSDYIIDGQIDEDKLLQYIRKKHNL